MPLTAKMILHKKLPILVLLPKLRTIIHVSSKRVKLVETDKAVWDYTGTLVIVIM